MQLHVLSNCPVAVNSGRYKWRHDSILVTITTYFQPLLQQGYELYADLKDFNTKAQLFRSCRLDIGLVKDRIVYIFELTVCFETNTEKSRNYKIDRYKNLNNELLVPYVQNWRSSLLNSWASYKRHDAIQTLL